MPWGLIACGIAYPPVFAMLGMAADMAGRIMLFIVFPLVSICSGYLVYRLYARNLVDEVWDCGDALLIRNGGSEFHVALTNCLNVSLSSYVNPPYATIMLRHDINHENRVQFLPPVELLPYVTPPVINELTRRIDAARSQ